MYVGAGAGAGPPGKEVADPLPTYSSVLLKDPVAKGAAAGSGDATKAKEKAAISANVNAEAGKLGPGATLQCSCACTFRHPLIASKSNTSCSPAAAHARMANTALNKH